MDHDFEIVDIIGVGVHSFRKRFSNGCSAWKWILGSLTFSGRAKKEGGQFAPVVYHKFKKRKYKMLKIL